jgi:hypothetical protein
MIYTPKNLAELELENNLFDNPLQCEGFFNNMNTYEYEICNNRTTIRQTTI